jgi:CHAT domain-containing protein/Tfp pilus assembly protein PilF
VLPIRLEMVRGSAWRFRGFHYRAAAHYSGALDLAERAGHGALRATALSMLASLHHELGDWSRTMDYAQRAFDAVPNPSYLVRYNYHLQRGIAFYEFNDGPRAEASFREALAIAQGVGNRRDEGLALGELGLVVWRYEGIDLFERAIALARETAVPALEATWLNNLGGVHRDAGRLDDALACYREAMAIETRTGQRRQRAMLLKNIGQVLALMGQGDEAERVLVSAMQAADEQNTLRIRWQARMELGGVHAGVDDGKAERFFRESLDLLEAQQSSVLLERFRAGVLGYALSQYDPYDRYVQFLAARGDAAGAFVVAERARARVFLETLGSARAELSATVPDAYIREEAELLERLSAAQAELRRPDVAAGERADLLTSIDEADDRLTALRLRLAVDHPPAAHARFPKIWTVDGLQTELLRDDETLVMFFLGRDASFAWLVDRGRLDIVRLPARDRIAAETRRLLPTLQSPDARVDEDARAWLSRTLVEPIVARVQPGRHLLIVPHAALNYLPFEVLAAESGRYLVERHPISYVPSVSSLAHLRLTARRAGGSAGVLAVGNPITAAGPAAGERNTPLEWIGRLKPLPHSGVELERIAAAFDGVRLLDGAEATESALRGAIGSGGVAILHLATHAFIDEARPERSALVLSAGGDGGDGLLQMREVYGLSLPAALVTLSACETALGRDVTGEGIVGIARAFFYAGATAVTASLWNVGDASTATLMAEYYARIGAGEPVDRALALAKRAMLANGGREAHPYYWAPFIVMGHARVALDLPAASSPAARLMAAGVAALFVLMLAARAARRRAPTPP